MTQHLSSNLDIVAGHVGDVVSRVERVFFEFQGKLEEEEGEVQLRFARGGVLRFRGSANGELIEVSELEWHDPFQGHMSHANVEFVRTHGHWRLVDVSMLPKCSELVGTSLTVALPLTNRFGSLMGVQLKFEGKTMNIFVHADGVRVSWGTGTIRTGVEFQDDDSNAGDDPKR